MRVAMRQSEPALGRSRPLRHLQVEGQSTVAEPKRRAFALDRARLVDGESPGMDLLAQRGDLVPDVLPRWRAFEDLNARGDRETTRLLPSRVDLEAGDIAVNQVPHLRIADERRVGDIDVEV